MTRIGFTNSFYQICWWFRRLSAGFVKPLNVLRVCRRRNEVLQIVNEATRHVPPWSPDLVERVVQYVLEYRNPEVSVYRTATTNPLDHDHALGVIAERIGQYGFRRNATKRASGCTRTTLLIPTTSLPIGVRLRFTPQNNLNFFPANVQHYDLSANETRELAEIILDGIHNNSIHWAFLGSDDGSYRVQAAIAYSHCLSSFGNLNVANPPPRWQDGKDLTNADQIEILTHLAKASALDSPRQ